jgi:predicted metal-dependent hydrolase
MQAIWSFTSSKRAIRTASDGPVFSGGGHERVLTLIRSPQSRRMRLVVDPRDGAVKLTLPTRASQSEALKWAETKRRWIETQLAVLPQPNAILPGMMLCVAGKAARLAWHQASPRTPKLVGDELIVGGPLEMLEARVMRWLKRQALQILSNETHEFAAKQSITIGKIGVGDPVSRWGSCAASGDIRYSWRLILAPEHVRRATVAHEVAHRIHMNHGPAFHALVAELFGADPSPARRWLRANGAALHWFGRAG